MYFEDIKIAPDISLEKDITYEKLQPYTFETDVRNQIEYIDKIENLSESVWRELSPAERLETLKELEARLAEIQGRDPRLVVAIDYPSDGESITFGHYSPENRERININEMLLGRPEMRLQAIHTLAHEGRHAFQDDVVRGLIPFDENIKAIWTVNFPHYLTFEKYGPEIYGSQPVEMDANSFADRIIKEIEYKGEESLTENIKGKINWDEIFDTPTVNRFIQTGMYILGQSLRKI